MINKEEYKTIKNDVISRLEKAGIVLSEKEKDCIEIADFGLNDVYNTGLELITYINTERVCAKELVLLPNQTCPEHYHPPFEGYSGKEETFRCRSGIVYLYIEGEPTQHKSVETPELGQEFYTVFKEIALKPGDQYTIDISTKHWFKAGNEGAIVSEFSTPSFDERDIFTNPNIERTPKVG